MAEAIENGERLILSLGQSYNEGVAKLREDNKLTQENLLKVFKTLVTNLQPEFAKQELTFQSVCHKPFYQLVNITDTATEFVENGKAVSFHPRLLLWTGQPSVPHTHPASGDLQPNDISCVYYAVTAGSTEIRYQLEDEINGKANSIRLLPERSLGVDRYTHDIGERLAHTFIPAPSPLENIKVTTLEGTEAAVHTVTLNLYNAAEPGKGAAGQVVTDTHEDVTKRELGTLRKYQHDLGLKGVTLTAKDKAGFQVSDAVIDRSVLVKIKDGQTKDDAGWAHFVRSNNRVAAVAAMGV